jgi:hypothetical protein
VKSRKEENIRRSRRKRRGRIWRQAMRIERTERKDESIRKRRRIRSIVRTKGKAMKRKRRQTYRKKYLA